MGSEPLIPVLLDTHVLVWLFDGSSRIGPQTLAHIDEATSKDAVFISAITPWEIALLEAKGRLNLNQDSSEWIKAILKKAGIHLTPLSVDVAVDSTRLPDDFHSDPADRIIVATARNLGALLVTQDRLILDYAAKGHLNARRADQ